MTEVNTLFDKLVKKPASWMVSSPGDDIILTSRIRLARNLRGASFPGWAKRQDRLTLYGSIMEALSSLPGLKGGFLMDLSDLSQIQKQILVERHLISRGLAARSEGCGVAISGNKSLSVMVNEEDHLRMQYILPGQQLKKAWSSIDKIDTDMEEKVPYAYDERMGYLTACPTNLGTGMRASAMLHLPGLALLGYMEQVVKAAQTLDLTVRGIYGEGTQGLGNLFQVSNQRTLGVSEKDILEKLRRIITDIAKQEKNARNKLYQENFIVLANRVARSYGILKYCVNISNQEALEHISMLRLGSSLGLFKKNIQNDLSELILNTQTAHLQYPAQIGESIPYVNDIRRADIIQTRFKTIPEPTIVI